MKDTFYEVNIKINPISPPHHVKDYTHILPPSYPVSVKNTDLPNYGKRDSIIIEKKNSKWLCIRWC
jgi:hypothetical protein